MPTKALPRLLLLACGLIALACLALAFIPTGRPEPVRIALQAAPATYFTPAPPEGDIAINSASAAELQQLPGIGPHLAEQIVAAREVSPFFFPEDLKAVKGIGDRRLKQILPYIRMD